MAEAILDIRRDVLAVLDEVLSLNGRGDVFTDETPLLGAIPELDSMAVVSILTTIEDRFGVMIDDDEIDGTVFATVGSLTRYVAQKIAA